MAEFEPHTEPNVDGDMKKVPCYWIGNVGKTLFVGG
jgi:hypothetical protein